MPKLDRCKRTAEKELKNAAKKCYRIEEMFNRKPSNGTGNTEREFVDTVSSRTENDAVKTQPSILTVVNGAENAEEFFPNSPNRDKISCHDHDSDLDQGNQPNQRPVSVTSDESQLEYPTESTDLDLEPIPNQRPVSVTSDESQLEYPTDIEPNQRPVSVTSDEFQLEYPTDISSNRDNFQSKPLYCTFPWKSYGKSKRRRFNLNYMKTHSWLEYSVQKDSAYCFVCRHYSISKSKSPFVQPSGYCNWLHANTENLGFRKHETSEEHKLSLQNMLEWRKRENEQMQVDDLLKLADQSERARNREYINTIAEVVLFCGMNELPLRGHNESELSTNKGNFLELIDLISKHDASFASKIKAAPQNATYMSPQIQNELTETIASVITDEIVQEINDSTMFAILVDECRDVSKKEQLSLILRYVNTKTEDLNESFIGFVQAKKLDAESLCVFVVDTLKSKGIAMEMCVAQCYDGAAVMSGHTNGLQARILKYSPLAVYTHCYAHRVNLILVDVIRQIQKVADAAGTLETLFSYISSSYVHSVFKDIMNEEEEFVSSRQDRARELKRLQEVRWSSQSFAMDSVKTVFTPLTKTLLKIISERDAHRRTMAMGLLQQIRTFDFCFYLIVIGHVLRKTTVLTEALQIEGLDAVVAISLIGSTREALEKFRTDETVYDSLWEECADFAKKHSVQMPDEPRQRRKRTEPEKFRNFVVLETTGHRSIPDPDLMDVKKFYRDHFLFPVIDLMLTEFGTRFGDLQLGIYKSLSALNPKSENFMKDTYLQPLINHYNPIINNERLHAELPHAAFFFKNQIESRQANKGGSKAKAKRAISSKGLLSVSKSVRSSYCDATKKIESSLPPVSLTELYQAAKAHEDVFPETVKLIQLVMTIPITTASCERSFSAMKRIKTYLRNSMNTSRLSSLAVIAIERERASKLKSCMTKVVEKFRIINRRILL